MQKDRNGDELAIGDEVILHARVDMVDPDSPVLGVIISPTHTKADAKIFGGDDAAALNDHTVTRGPLTVHAHWLEKA